MHLVGLADLLADGPVALNQAVLFQPQWEPGVAAAVSR
jgi:hypothetical protein